MRDPKSVRRGYALRLKFAIQKRAIQLLNQFDQLLWILLAASCLGKYPPILNLGLHGVTSVALQLFNLLKCTHFAKRGIVCSFKELPILVAAADRVRNASPETKFRHTLPSQKMYPRHERPTVKIAERKELRRVAILI
jgi:hypothetical protein